MLSFQTASRQNSACGKQTETGGKTVKSLGIDLGGTSAKIGIVEDGVILESLTVPTRPDSDYDGIVRDLSQAALSLTEKHKIRKVGIGSPGLIDSVTGKVCYSNNIRWSDAPLREDLAKILRAPALIANDAKCAALGEALYGAGKGCRRVAMLTLGTGVGGGFVVDGRLESGSMYADAAGIFGHMTLYPGGRNCNCGRKGCLEAYCSATAVAAEASEAFGKSTTAKELFDQARGGNARACTIVDEFARNLGTALVSLANILRPECFVIGGGVSASADLFLPVLNEMLEKEAYGASYAPVKAVAARLGNSAGIIGAASLR